MLVLKEPVSCRSAVMIGNDDKLPTISIKLYKCACTKGASPMVISCRSAVVLRNYDKLPKISITNIKHVFLLREPVLWLFFVDLYSRSVTMKVTGNIDKIVINVLVLREPVLWLFLVDKSCSGTMK